jgi:hypothetical protein
MRTIATITLSAFVLAGGLVAAAAQDNAPATHRGTGTEIANNYRFFNEDRERMRNGTYQRAMEAARQNMDAYATLRARQGRPVAPRR